MNKKFIIKICLIIVLIVILVFLINLGRKVYILSKYSNEYKNLLNVTNFYKKSNPEDGVITEFWRKDNLGLFKRTSNDDIKMIYYGNDYNYILVDNKDSKTAVKMEKDGPGIESQNLVTGTLFMQNLEDIIKMAFLSSISTEKINNIECYKIKINNDWQIYVNKQNFLVIREINGSTDTGIIEYKINEVSNEDVLIPDLEGYTLNDTTKTQ